MAKKQKVKFHRGDRRPATVKYSIFYKKKMVKRKDEIVWQVIEYPTKSIVNEYFFEEDANKLVKFQNKYKVWQENGGLPSFLCLKSYKYKR